MDITKVIEEVDPILEVGMEEKVDHLNVKRIQETMEDKEKIVDPGEVTGTKVQAEAEEKEDMIMMRKYESAINWIILSRKRFYYLCRKTVIEWF